MLHGYETKSRLMGVNVLEPAEEQICDVCGERGHEHCVEMANGS